MKLLFTAFVLLAIAAVSGVAQASETRSYCYIGPKTVTVDDHSASTPAVTLPCPQGTP